MPWIEQFDDKPPSRDAESLLTTQQTVEWNALGMFATHLGIVVTIILAVVGACVAAANSKHVPICFAAFGAPMLVAGVRWFSVASLDRYYGRFLEAVVVQQKLRYVVEKPEGAPMPFPNDPTLDVARYWGREPNDDASRWIAQYMSKGHNRIAWLLFQWLFGFSFVPALLAAVRLWTWPTDLGSTPPEEAVVGATLVVVALVAALANVYGTRWITKQRRVSYGSA